MKVLRRALRYSGIVCVLLSTHNIEAQELLNKDIGGITVKLDTGKLGNEGSKELISLSSDQTRFTANIVNSFEVQDPHRFVVDLKNDSKASSKKLALKTPVGTLAVPPNGSIKAIRYSTSGDKIRFVFDLNQNTSSVIAPIANIADGAVHVSFSADNKQAVDNKVSTNEMILAAPSGGENRVELLTFVKDKDSAGQVTVSFTGSPNFKLKQTAASEYTLFVKSSDLSEQPKLPQLSPATTPGIRSARAVKVGDDVAIRMFIDKGVTLTSRLSGANIVVEGHLGGDNLADSNVASDADARAQLAEAKKEEEKSSDPKTDGEQKTEVKEGDAAAKNDQSGSGAQVVEGNDDTARQNPTGISSADGSKVYTGRLISLDLQETDIDNALRIIAEVSNLNIIASDDVTGKVTLRLIDVPWDQALDVILKTNGLDQVTEGNVIRIAPVEKLREEREALIEANKAKERLEDLKVNYIRVSYAKATEMKEQVEAVLSERGSVAIDERTNQLIIKDITKGQDESAQLIKKLDLRTPQVLLETQIVEASRGVLRDLGFQWNFSYSEAPATGNATGLNFPNSIVSGGSYQGQGGGPANAISFPAALDAQGTAGTAITTILDSADGSRALSMRLTALEQDNQVRVISRPQVATVNNKQAEIKSTQTVRVRLPSAGLAVATGSGAAAQGGAASAFQEIDVGISLKVTPQASPDYYVLLDVNAKSSTFGDREVDGIPSTLEREATSTILVKSGQTFALGGVYRINDADRSSGVPYLRTIPILGQLFRRSFIDKSDEELIFFITPHIVEGSFDPSLM
jgi:type IV pilus secretin PilQ/predicted competence protein